MSLLNIVENNEIFAADEKPADSIFEFKETERTEQEIRSQIHEKFGICLINPCTLEPDTFHQAYSHILPEGFSFDPQKVQSIRVRVSENETSFHVIPFEETGIGVFSFRISQNESNHHIIPPELLLSDLSGKIAA